MRKEIFALKCSEIGIIEEVIFKNSLDIDIKVGQAFVELFDESTHEKAQAFFLQSNKTDDKCYLEYELYVPTKDAFCLLYFKSLIVDKHYLIIAEQEESDYFQLFGSLSSINSELILTQKALNKKNKELLRVNELKNRLIGIAAHDLRNPISLIYSYSDLLLEDCKKLLDEDHYDFVNDINITAKFMLALVEELLDLTYLESGNVSLKPEKLDFYDLFTENIKYAITLGAKKGITVNAQKPHRGLFVNIDKNKIQQVISNFISNAIKYSHPNSIINIACSVKNSDILFSCHDHGYGIDKSEFEIIFEPFKKAKSSQFIKEQSTGLGLAISQKIIQAHKGKIWLESQVDKGSTFYFSLPMES